MSHDPSPIAHSPSPILSLIVAVARNGVIGRGNTLPWHLPADLKHFKSVTMGRPVIMGRKTYESIGRPLPGRKNIVVTRNTDFRAVGCEVVASLDAALHVAASVSGPDSGSAGSRAQPQARKEIFVIGGAQLYAEALAKAGRIYITRIEEDIEGDTFFPAFDTGAWRILSSESGTVDEKNPLPHRFEVLEKK